MEGDDRTPLGAVLRKAGGPAILDLLDRRLTGAELTTLLLAVFERHAGRTSPAEVLRRYTADRFTVPAPVPWRQLRHGEDALLAALPPEQDRGTGGDSHATAI